MVALIGKDDRTKCGCQRCWRERNPDRPRVMIVCDICGNKRCPHATDHLHACTGSNEPGQAGSRYFKAKG